MFEASATLELRMHLHASTDTLEERAVQHSLLHRHASSLSRPHATSLPWGSPTEEEREGEREGERVRETERERERRLV